MNPAAYERLVALSPDVLQKAEAVARGAVDAMPDDLAPTEEPAHVYVAEGPGKGAGVREPGSTERMSDTELGFMSLGDASDAIGKGSLSPVELVEALIARTERLDPQLHCYLLPCFDVALTQARAIEGEIGRGGQKGPMHGLPFGLKDIIDTAGIRTTCHSKILEHNVPSKDAEVAARLKRAGAIMMGKLATHEFAFGGPCFDLPWEPARNPWNIAHHPGGSSSGAGASVAAGLLPGALGSDTGGSVRNPASCCGLVGMKPTYGRVPRTGVFPLAYSLDNVGPLTRTVRDNAMMMQVLSGFDRADPASANNPVPDFSANLNTGIKGLRIGYVRHFHTQDMIADPEVAAGLDTVAEVLSGLGADVQDTQIQPLAVYAGGNRILLTVEGFAVHRKWLQERPQDYAKMTREKLMPGAFIGGADYVDAMRMRTRLRDEFARHMEQFDALICVSSMEPPCLIDDDEEVARTYPRQARAAFNFLGCPAMSVPCGFHSNGLPLSFQVVGKVFDEAMLYQVAAAYEAACDWTSKRPAMAS